MNKEEILRSDALATLVGLALAEDRVHSDVTSQCLVPPDRQAQAQLVAKEDGVLAGMLLLDPSSPLAAAFPRIRFAPDCDDGRRIRNGERLARLSGPARDLLAIERTLLNFLQRMSGIATETARFVAETAGTRARIQETRKTCPGFRALDKYAVRTGGGLNHRQSLADQVLIKENHLVDADPSSDRTAPGRIAHAVHLARSRVPAGMIVEVEVEDLQQFDAALAAGPDVIMLDDFSVDDIAIAVRRRNATGSVPLLEVSGSVRIERIAPLARLGVDRISVGALTHSVRALDLSLKILAEPLP